MNRHKRLANSVAAKKAPQARAFRTNGGGRNYNLPQSSIVVSMPPASSSVALQDEVNSLLREKLDLHSELFEAAQIQRKLSGPREFRHGSLRNSSSCGIR
jgi:hypothetical protein